MEENTILNYFEGNAQKRKARDTVLVPDSDGESSRVKSKSRKDVLRSETMRQEALTRFQGDGIVYNDETATWGCTVCAAALRNHESPLSSFAQHLATPKQARDILMHILSKGHERNTKASLDAGRAKKASTAPAPQPLYKTFADKEQRVVAMALGYILTNSSFRQWPELLDTVQGVCADVQGVPTSTASLCRRLHAAATVQWDELLEMLSCATATAVMLDEAQESSGKAVLLVYVAYITSSSQLHTRFLCLRELVQKDAESIFATTTEALAAAKLTWADISALTTDGAALLQGARAGIVTLARKENPLILTAHCCSHRMQLAVAKAAKEDDVLRFLDDTLAVLHKALTDCSVVRKDWEKHHKENYDALIRLPGHAASRWTSRATAVEFLNNNCVQLVCFFAKARSDDKTHQATLEEVRDKLASVDFVYTVFWWHAAFSALTPLVEGLQRQHVTYGDVQRLASAAINELKRIAGTHEAATTWLQELAFQAVDWRDGVPYLGSVRLHSQLQKEDDPQTAEEQAMAAWVTTATSAILGELLGRFPDDDVMECLLILDPNEYKDGGMSMTSTINGMAVDYEGNVKKLQQLVDRWYPDSEDSPNAHDDEARTRRNQEMLQIGQELRDVAERQPDQPLSIVEFWRPHWDRASLSVIFLKCSHILAVMPMSTAECEHGFSTMNLVKPPVRSRMIIPMLNTLLRLHLDFKGLKKREAMRLLDSRRAAELLREELGAEERCWDGILTDIFDMPLPEDCDVQDPETEENNEYNRDE